jgi:hypothetical protein
VYTPNTFQRLPLSLINCHSNAIFFTGNRLMRNMKVMVGSDVRNWMLGKRIFFIEAITSGVVQCRQASYDHVLPPTKAKGS